MEPIEKNLKKLFNELKAQDLRGIPTFDAVLTPPHPQEITLRPQGFRFAFGMTLAALAAAVLVIVSLDLRARSRQAEIRRWAALSNWEAPSDALLDISNPLLSGGATVSTDFLITPDNNTTSPSL